jgi:hypothetical protein
MVPAENEPLWNDTLDHLLMSNVRKYRRKKNVSWAAMIKDLTALNHLQTRHLSARYKVLEAREEYSQFL